MSTLDGYLLSSSERLFIRHGIAEGLRADGRSLLSYRHLNVEQNVIPQAAGSAQVSLGDTQVLVAIKGDIEEVDQANSPRLVFSVETSSQSLSQLRESDDRVLRQEECTARASRISRIFEGCLDLNQLEIANGRFQWKLFVDILIINDSGNLFDVIVCAVKAALSSTRLPKVMVEEGEAVGLSVSDDPSDLSSLACGMLPVSVTFAVFCHPNSFSFVADPNSAEEASSDCLISVGVDPKERITFTRKHFSQLSTGTIECISVDIIEALLAAARSISPALISETSLEISSYVLGREQ